MKQLFAYLTFNGNCRDAMHFYQECLGGTLSLQTIGESSVIADMPAQIKRQILHASLVCEGCVLMGSDMVGDPGLTRGNSVSLMLYCDSREGLYDCYNKLSRGGKASYPPQDTFWGGLSANLTDRFGNHWLLHFNPEGEQQDPDGGGLLQSLPNKSYI